MRNHPLIALAVTFVVTLWVTAGVAVAEEAKEEITFDRWYQLLMQGQPAGWAHTQTIEEGDRITTAMDMEISVSRGAVALTIKTASRFAETREGKAIESRVMQDLGIMKVIKLTKFSDDGITVITDQGGGPITEQVANPEQAWMPPDAAKRYVHDQFTKGEKTIRVWTLDPSAGLKPFQVTSTYRGDENVEVFGKVVRAEVWESVASNMPGITMREYSDSEGEMLKTSLTIMPGMDMVMLAADKDLATAKIDAPELLAATFVTPSKPIAGPRTTKKQTYVLTISDGGKASIPTTGYQQARKLGNGRYVVTVDLNAGAIPTTEKPGDEYRKPSADLNSSDPEIVKLTKEALGARPHNPPEAAELLRRFVHGYIDEKSLAVGFATASEVARTKQGDCSEHAVLLAALLRAADIPSRTASGLIYVDSFAGQGNIFGYHMWTQAWIDPDGKGERWVDLDATLPNSVPFDAAHITLGTNARDASSLTNDIVALTPVLGKLKIEVK